MVATYPDLEPGLGLVASVHPRTAGVFLDAQVVDDAIFGRRRQTNFDPCGGVHDAIFQHLKQEYIFKFEFLCDLV